MRLTIVLLLAVGLFAQQPGATPPAAPATTSAQQGGCKAALASSEFTGATADCILVPIQQGLISHNSRQVVSVFDKAQFEGYESLEEQLTAMFERYANIRAAYRILSTKVDGPRATLVVEFDLEESGRSGAYPPVRRRQQVRFELQRGDKAGWKVVDYTPRGFLA